MLFATLAATSADVAATSARLGKVEVLAGCLRRAQPDEVAIVVSYLSGELRQRRSGVGYAALRGRGEPASSPSLTVQEVDEAFERIAALAGAGSKARRTALLGELFARATSAEQRFLVDLVGGEVRQGALEGVMVEAVARATEVPASDLRRGLMLRGSLPAVAEAAATGGREALASFRLEVGRPLQPMLAQTADGVAAALERIRPAAVEEKLDGVRIQVHRSGRDVRIFTRTLDEITGRVPEIVDAALTLPVSSVVLDGEAIALFDDGRPRPFQQTASRVATRGGGGERSGRRSGNAGTAPSSAAPLTAYFFDVLHLDGEDLLEHRGADRHTVLARVVPQALRVSRIVTDDVARAGAFLDEALARGHEGVVMKSLDAAYEAGRRGAGWIKVKPVHTLDLVVLAAEWGHGRRRGWLSNLHLGARDPQTGGFVMLGKTFKGLTDAMLAEQTERLLALEVRRDDWTVYVRPELVVEIAFDGVQASPRYPGKVALRFARVLRYRPDKRAADADLLDAVRALHATTAGSG